MLGAPETQVPVDLGVALATIPIAKKELWVTTGGNRPCEVMMGIEWERFSNFGAGALALGIASRTNEMTWEATASHIVQNVENLFANSHVVGLKPSL